MGSTSKVAAYFGMPKSTVHNIVERYKKDGNQLKSKRANCGRKAREYPPRFLNWLVSQRTLTEMAYKGLKERSAVIKQVHGLDIPVTSLRNLYDRLGVTWTKPETVSANFVKKAKRVGEERKEFAFKLTQIIDADEPIVYADETSFNTW